MAVGTNGGVTVFTGIISYTKPLTRVNRRADSARIEIELPEEADSVDCGESIALSGVCLTVSDREGARISFDVMRETLSRTTLANASKGELVNVERALQVGDRLGGHFVQGHVDCTARVMRRTDFAASRDIAIGIPEAFAAQVVEKGSIAVNGVSLTVAAIENRVVTVALIPTTLANTNLGFLKVGDMVNIEFDILGKYSAQHQAPANAATRITPEFLQEHGFLQ